MTIKEHIVKNKLLCVGISVFLSMISTEVYAQQNDGDIIQMSGIVITKDSTVALPGVHIYVPQSGRGATSSSAGYFSLPVLKNDTLLISSLGYERRTYIVPDTVSSQFLTVLIEMTPDITLLEEVEIMPYLTEKDFKEAVLALHPSYHNGFSSYALNRKIYSEMLKVEGMGGYGNYRYYMNQYQGSIGDAFGGRTNPFLNPFNWYRFFRDLKKKKNK